MSSTPMVVSTNSSPSSMSAMVSRLQLHRHQRGLYRCIDADGKPIDNRTPAQKDALMLLLHKLKQKFPTAQIMGHRDIWGTDRSNWRKMCPCFNAIQEYKDIA